ncbi:hypothetical protein [Geodermatophilus ruber]|uniref:DUF1565 domain-containing protein n=1 Tax=Geodermatophilus ruber TaxID=504800 RepID=A0A1I4DF92_9ACTN|nr:hypothetical protein [Geodermatophilus ruber]SFK92122.1 hypothetical protein SAMN04488085_104361 [Geodermatophilus ruber]
MADPSAEGRRGRRAVLLLGLLLVAVLLAGGVVLATRDGGSGSPQAPPGRPAPEAVGAGEQYAVSPDGDDDASGRPDAPWRTLEHALSRLGPGDVLVVGDGRYRENIDLDLRAGTPEAPVRVVAAADARPVVVGLLWLADLSWWDIRGLNVTWDEDNDADEHMVKLTDGEGWRFADAELWGARSFAALLVDGEPQEFTLSGLYVHDTYPSNETNQDHLVYLNCGTGGGVLERSILAHSSNGRAIKIGGPRRGSGEVGDIVVRYVTMVDNRGPSNVQLAYETSDVVIENSILVGAAAGRPNVTAFGLDGAGNTVRDSLGWESTGMLEDVDGLSDGGGNVRRDPRLSGPGSARPYFPADEQARAYGRWAGVDDE